MEDFDGPHTGFTHNRHWWDWASHDDHNKWVTGSRPPGDYDRAGWECALQLISLCPNYRDLHLLEWGCGSGRVTQYLAYLFRHVLAVDIAPSMLERVQQRALPNLALHLTRGSDLPPNAVIDVAYSYTCWFHNLKSDLIPILQACRRTLRTGGRLLFQLPVYEVSRDPRSFQDIACWTPDECDELAKATGFRIVRLCTNSGAFRYDRIGPHHYDLHEWHPVVG